MIAPKKSVESASKPTPSVFVIMAKMLIRRILPLESVAFGAIPLLMVARYNVLASVPAI
ncbi:MAG: hypothetical protein PVS3B3_15790 [Ktedonobacteraceae bacterium]